MVTEKQAEDFIEDIQHFALHWKGVECVDTDVKKAHKRGSAYIVLRVFVHYDEE